MKQDPVGFAQFTPNLACSQDFTSRNFTSRNFTVAIPTYNGAKTLPQLLAQLQTQRCPEGLTWEVIVVDNNSSDQTAEVVRRVQQDWRSDVPLRYVHESRQGVSHARQRAVVESCGEWVGFLDDDNFAAPNWVSAAYDFGQAHPQAGAIGGQVSGLFSAPPPVDLGRAARFLAISKYSHVAKRYDPNQLRLPAGAGLVIRRCAWEQSIPARLTRITRGGNDYEISLRLHQQGWEIWYNPDMQIEHHIPSERLEKRYLTLLAGFYGLCTCEVRLIIAPRWQKPLLLAKSFLGGGRRLLWHLLTHRRQAFRSLELACETAFLAGAWLSPGYYLYRRLAALLQAGG